MYGGDVTSSEAFEALSSNPDAVLVDVRTRPELAYVGMPDLSTIGKRVVVVEWQTYPQGTVNRSFVSDLADAGVSPSSAVYFLCRSGVRSRSAATVAASAGYDRAFNVSDGFEGNHDPLGHRGTVSGWKVSGLPWRQQ